MSHTHIEGFFYDDKWYFDTNYETEEPALPLFQSAETYNLWLGFFWEGKGRYFENDNSTTFQDWKNLNIKKNNDSLTIVVKLKNQWWNFLDPGYFNITDIRQE